jgi:cysteine desulfuration protein SufE
MTINELKENFAILNGEEKYGYLLDLAKMLPTMDSKYKCEDCLIKGCASKVYIRIDIKDGKLDCHFDSDSDIVKGVLYIFYLCLQGKEVKEAKNINFNEIIGDLGLLELLTSPRQNGVLNIINSINAVFS